MRQLDKFFLSAVNAGTGTTHCLKAENNGAFKISGRVAGGTAGAVLAAPFWLGVIVFGAIPDDQGMFMSKLMLNLGVGTVLGLGYVTGEALGLLDP